MKKSGELEFRAKISRELRTVIAWEARMRPGTGGVPMLHEEGSRAWLKITKHYSDQTRPDQGNARAKRRRSTFFIRRAAEIIPRFCPVFIRSARLVKSPHHGNRPVMHQDNPRPVLATLDPLLTRLAASLRLPSLCRKLSWLWASTTHSTIL